MNSFTFFLDDILKSNLHSMDQWKNEKNIHFIENAYDSQNKEMLKNYNVNVLLPLWKGIFVEWSKTQNTLKALEKANKSKLSSISVDIEKQQALKNIKIRFVEKIFGVPASIDNPSVIFELLPEDKEIILSKIFQNFPYIKENKYSTYFSFIEQSMKEFYATKPYSEKDYLNSYNDNYDKNYALFQQESKKNSRKNM